MVVILHRFGVFADDFGDILHLIGGVVIALMPCPVEHGDELVLFLVAGILVFADFASERVGRRPRIAVDSLSESASTDQADRSERHSKFG